MVHHRQLKSVNQLPMFCFSVVVCGCCLRFARDLGVGRSHKLPSLEVLLRGRLHARILNPNISGCGMHAVKANCLLDLNLHIALCKPADTLQAHFTESTTAANTVISGFVFLRLICAAILGPQLLVVLFYPHFPRSLDLLLEMVVF